MSVDKSNTLKPPTKEEAKSFCDLCEFVYVCWVSYTNLFEELPSLLESEKNTTLEEFLESPYGRCLQLINCMVANYLILQIAKLHDQAKLGNNENLSINLFVAAVNWSVEDKKNIQNINTQLFDFYNHIKMARDKLLAHNDRETYKTDKPLGCFPEGEDKEYFRLLGEFCELIWEHFSPWEDIFDKKRIFHFKKQGIPNDKNCPSYDARTLRDFIVKHIPESPFGDKPDTIT